MAPPIRGPQDTLIRASRQSSDGEWVERHQILSASAAAWLPSLQGPTPSLLRDSVELVLASGVASVEVLLLRSPRSPLELGAPTSQALLDTFLDRMHGTLLLMPDAARLPDRGPVRDVDPGVAWVRLAKLVRASAQGWRERYQIALLDAPPGPPSLVERAVPRIQGADAALVTWQGSPEDLGRQAWRSGAAALAGALVAPQRLIHHGPTGLRLPLGPGRRVRPSARFVDPGTANVGAVRDPSLLRLDLERGGLAARVQCEPTLRRPTGVWPLAAMRTAKTIHRRIVEAADAVVFQPVNAAYAFLLTTTIDTALRPFVTHGLLVGPNGVGGPEITAVPVRSTGAPGLAATISGQLRPWCTQVRVRVEVREGGNAQLVVQP